MISSRFPIGVSATGLLSTVLLSMLVAGGALAQAPGDGANKPAGQADSGATKPAGGDAEARLKDLKITLNADQENLIDALRTLMRDAKLDFVIDADLKAGTATVHFKDVPFKDALATIVKVSTMPITYDVKDGIYHFRHRDDPPPTPAPAEDPKAVRPRMQAGRVPVSRLSSADAMRKLAGAYDTLPPIIYQHSTTPISHGSTTSFGFSGSGLLQSNSIRYNPDGSVSRSASPPLNIFSLLRGLLGR
jgi:hypothetical protein